MKNVKKIFILLFSFLLTGCCTYNMQMGINKDKSVTLSLVYTINTSALNGFNTNQDDTTTNEDETNPDEDNTIQDDVADEEFKVDEEQKKKLEEKGFKVEDYTNGNENGVKISKTYASIDNISTDKDIEIIMTSMLEDNFDDTYLFTKQGNTYSANYIFDFSSTDSTGMDLSAYQNYFNLSFKLTLPEKSLESNATTISEDGKELTWNMTYGKTTKVNFKFSMGPDFILITGIAVDIILLGLDIYLTIKNIKKNKKN